MPLDTYFRILKSDALPRFRIASKIPAGMNPAGAEILSTDELLEHHRELVQPFYETAIPPVPDYFPRGDISLLDLKALIAHRMMSECMICENRCMVDRTADQRGKCRVGNSSFYASEFLHLGEESELVPSHTVFFTGCTFECVFCQNWDIAHGRMASADAGYPVDENLVETIMKREKTARNLNLVGGNPDQHLANVLDILIALASRGYSRPIVWNSNLYMTPDALELLTGVADVHLADFKYGTNECGKKLSGIDNYWDVVTRNLLAVSPVSDIIIRHLVLPGHLECCTARVVEWTSKNLPDARFNLMFQYHPDYRAGEHPEINRFLSDKERERALELAREAGLG